ncbi:MAG: host-nuclease inhibitor Gam family protein [Candidatus Gastranaerophilaceae bacterium]
MAKKIESTLKNWEDVDASIKQIAELSINKTRLEGEQTLQINEIKKNTAQKAKGIDLKIKELEKDIERFTESHKNEFTEKRNKKLNYGTVSYKIVKRVCCTCVEEAIKALKALKLDFCIRTKQELDKDRLLADVDENTLLKAGITIKKEDKLRIEPNFEKIAATVTQA